MNGIYGTQINKIVQKTLDASKNNADKVKAKFQEATDSKDDSALMDACKEFESIFMQMVIKEMRSTVPDGGLTEKSQAREMFEGLYDEEMSKEMTKNEGIGLAKMLYDSMHRKSKIE
jgi:flagellar protein FlgJ